MADNTPLSILNEGTHFVGKLTFKNRMIIHGEFEGEIVSTDQLTVGKTARIKADLKVAQLIVLGTISGTISACEKLEIHEGGSVCGDIHVKALDIKPGAVFDGRCSMVTDAGKGQK
jgi:cytoskeletal protein CcmA (bactofilin family)